MLTLLESPLPVILFGIIAEAVLGIVLVRTGRGVLIWVMIGVLVLVSAGVALEWLVVTDVETVEAAFESMAAALETNDPDAVLAHIDPAAADTRNLAAWGLRQVEFTKVGITRARRRGDLHHQSTHGQGPRHRDRPLSGPYRDDPLQQLSAELHDHAPMEI